MSERFSWVVEDFIAGMERPGLFRTLESDLSFLRSKGISAIVNLEEYERDYPGFDVCHLPVRDFGPPVLDTYLRFLEFVGKKSEEKKKVLVHCHAGMGRTNLMLASYLVKKNSLKPDLALNEVKSKRPLFLVTEEQEESLWEFYYTLK